MVPRSLNDILDSVVLITSTSNESFGTGFAIRSEQGDSWILTCAHVVKDMGNSSGIRVEDKSAEVIACGELEGVDLAVLKVQGLEISHLPLGGDGHKEMQCCIPGFTELSGKQKKAEPLEGSLGSEVVLKAPDSP